MAGADTGAGQDQKTMLGQQLPGLLDQRQDRLGAAIHIERPPILTT